MKKFVTFLTTGFLALMLGATTVLAAGNPDIAYVGKRSADETYTVYVTTNGKATDGVIEISYNTDALVCEEADVVVSTKVDLYSVNVEDGTVKISYVAEKAIKSGNLITVSFDVTEEYLEQEVSATVSGVSHDAKGKELSIGQKVEKPNNDKNDENSGNQSRPENQPSADESQKPADNKGKNSDKNKPGRQDASASQEEVTVEEVQTEEVQTEETQTEQVAEIADEAVPLANAAEQTSNMPVVVIILVVLCIAAVAVVFVVKKKNAK